MICHRLMAAAVAKGVVKIRDERGHENIDFEKNVFYGGCLGSICAMWKPQTRGEWRSELTWPKVPAVQSDDRTPTNRGWCSDNPHAAARPDPAAEGAE